MCQQDNACTVVSQCFEAFQWRKDHLLSRLTVPSQGFIQEKYASGGAHSLRSVSRNDNKRTIVMEFDPLVRVDSLVRRVQEVRAI